LPTLQHSDNRLVGLDSHFLHDLRSVYLGACRVKSDTRIRILHLGFDECRHERGRRLLERIPFLSVTDEFNGLCDLVHVMLQCGFQQGAFVGKALIKSSDRSFPTWSKT